MYSGSYTCFLNTIITMIILPPNTSHISTNQSIALFVIVRTIPAQFRIDVLKFQSHHNRFKDEPYPTGYYKNKNKD